MSLTSSCYSFAHGKFQNSVEFTGLSVSLFPEPTLACCLRRGLVLGNVARIRERSGDAHPALRADERDARFIVLDDETTTAVAAGEQLLLSFSSNGETSSTTP